MLPYSSCKTCSYHSTADFILSIGTVTLDICFSLFMLFLFISFTHVSHHQLFQFFFTSEKYCQISHKSDTIFLSSLTETFYHTGLCNIIKISFIWILFLWHNHFLMHFLIIKSFNCFYIIVLPLHGHLISSHHLTFFANKILHQC